MTKKVNAEWKQEVVMEIVRVKQIVMERPIQYQDNIASTRKRDGSVYPRLEMKPRKWSSWLFWIRKIKSMRFTVFSQEV